MEHRRSGKMVVISGPSGSGKTAICKLREDPRVRFDLRDDASSASGEVDGRDYHFITRERFRDLIAQGAFIERADVYGSMYSARSDGGGAGSRRRVPARDRRAGALQLMSLSVPGVCVFIAPPD